MRTELLEIADMNAVAVAHYYRGDNQRAKIATLAAFAKLTRFDESEHRLIQQRRQLCLDRQVCTSEASTSDTTETGQSNNETTKNSCCHPQVQDEQEQEKQETQEKQQPVLDKRSSYIDENNPFVTYIGSESDDVEDGDDEDDEEMFINDDPWTYGEAKYYAGRIKSEYTATVYAVQPLPFREDPSSLLVPVPGSIATGATRSMNTSTTNGTSTSTNVNETSSSTPSPTPSPTIHRSSSYHCRYTSDDSPVGTFNGAFLLSNDMPYASKETAGVLSYNLGLIHHRDALTTGAADTKLIWKALQMYQQSLFLIGQEDINFFHVLTGLHPPVINSSKSDMTSRFWYQRSVTLATLAVAIYCNIADIYCRFQAVSVKKLPLINLMAEVIRYLGTESGVTKVDMDRFCSAHCFLIQSLTNPPPAA